MSDLLAVVPCNYGSFIYYKKANTGGKNVLSCSQNCGYDRSGVHGQMGVSTLWYDGFLVELTIDFIRLGVKEYSISLSDIKNML